MTEADGQFRLTDVERDFNKSFPIELRRGSAYKIVPTEKLDEVATLEQQSDQEQFQDFCDSLPWEDYKLPAKTLATFKGISYGYYCIKHKGKFVVTTIQNPDNPDLQLTIVLTKAAFKKPSQQKKPRQVQKEIPGIDGKQSRETARRKKQAKAPETTPTAEKIPMTTITLHPGVRLFDFPKPRLKGQDKKQREATLNNLRPEVVEKKTKMRVKGKNPRDSYNYTEGTFFRGEIDGKECFATIGDVRQFAEIGRERERKEREKK